MLGDKTIQGLEQQLKNKLKKELGDQGHHLTGALESSVISQYQFGNATALEMYANDYINPVNDGVTAANIPFDSSRTTGAKHSKYIEALKNYAKLRFGIVDEKAALSAAFAIAKTHEKEGMPTGGSFKFSTNGRRTEALQETLERSTNVDQAMERGLDKEMDALLEMNVNVVI
ncbi:MAG TPA: hypothetical protein VFT58_06625 [Nitrososphaera sp.]|nr:hypothetical protein [Nitrososphaera sp.]